MGQTGEHMTEIRFHAGCLVWICNLLLVSLSFLWRLMSSRKCKNPVSPKVKISARSVVFGSIAFSNRGVLCPINIKMTMVKK